MVLSENAVTGENIVDLHAQKLLVFNNLPVKISLILIK